MTIYEVFFSPPALALWGLCIGSFLNVVVFRLPRMIERQWQLEASEILQLPAPDIAAVSLAAPPSRCPACGQAIAWYQNIPLVSWLWLRGRCAACQARISARYPLVETATAALFVLIGLRVGMQPLALLWCGFAATLLALALIDLDTRLLPDDMVLPLLWAGIIAAGLGWIPVSLGASVAGAVAGYLSLWVVAKLFWILRKKEGMGHGDFKLFAALGAWFGWQLLPSIILLSSGVGAIVGVAMMLGKGRGADTQIPFGPYLAGGGLAAFFFGAARTRLWMA
ncbi:MAG: A24 family peptidase [Pseudomonadota bacterium]|nr:A24 family peptidase [Pseudomonadota bacterium]